jgi:hypothetical protein
MALPIPLEAPVITTFITKIYRYYFTISFAKVIYTGYITS